MSSQLMLVPSLACPARCGYCFGPHAGGKSMRRETLEAVVDWQEALGDGDRLELTFHGGEPLVPGANWYREALPLLRDGLASRRVRFAAQSNLWLLTDELRELFREYGVSLGTSLDGPEEINDAQRGAGYFAKTMAGIERARDHGIDVGCICTFTAQSVPHASEIFDFFTCEGLNFSVHAALPSLRYPEADRWSITPESHGELLVGLLGRYLVNLSRVRISTLDSMARSVSTGRGGICTFGECLGGYLAIGPDGAIYPCQRFTGMDKYRVGDVVARPSLEELQASPVWQEFRTREEAISADGSECGDCAYLAFCRGGCPYNVLVSNGGSFDADRHDPLCAAYKQIFETIANRALDEVFSEENMTAVVEQAPDRQGLMRKGRLLQIMRDGSHPQEIARRASELVAAAALAVSTSPEEALAKLDAAGVIHQPNAALASLKALRRRLDNETKSDLVKAYLNVTYACNLRCSHCYAQSKPMKSPSMAVEDVARLVRELARAGFRKAIISGGEPLVHPRRDQLLDELAALRQSVKPLEIALRTNLACRLTPALTERLARSTDWVVVSVDGDEVSHDARRGLGTYARTISNIRTLAALAASERVTSLAPSARISIDSALDPAEMDGNEARTVHVLGEELGLPVSITPLLPLGRAANLGLKPELPRSLDEGAETLACDVSIRASCGLGTKISVGPSGECFPCYTLTEPAHCLGNVLTDGLSAVLERNDAYRTVTVDTINRCRDCGVRYICGGLCRAWGAPSASLDAAPVDCAALERQARRRLLVALVTLEIPFECWSAAGLPLPDAGGDA